MEKMKRICVLSACLMALVLVQAPCQTSGNDTWSAVTRLNQLNGTWKGGSSATLTMRQFMESQGVEWTSDTQRFYGNMNVKVDLNFTMYINAGRRTASIKGEEIFTFSGGNIRSAWSGLRDALTGDAAAVNNANYSITYTIDESDTITESDIIDYKINQNGRRMRVPFSEVGLSYIPEYFVFTKQ